MNNSIPDRDVDMLGFDQEFPGMAGFPECPALPVKDFSTMVSHAIVGSDDSDLLKKQPHWLS